MPIMNPLVPILFGIAGAGISWLALHLILRWGAQLRLARGPHDLHHTHKVPVPRIGGIALAIPFAIGQAVILLIAPSGDQLREQLIITGASLAMFALGLIDDFKALGARKKLLGQILISTAVFYAGIGIDRLSNPFSGDALILGPWGLPVTVIWLVAMTNLINLIDGVDGLAGGICLMLMVLLAYVGQGSGSVALVAAGVAGALIAFLRYNFPPARIYMGDGGAYFLGCLIGLLTIVSSQKGTIIAALVAPLFVLALPIADTALAIVRRGLRGLPLFRPDRQHIHHRLLEAGMSHRKLVLGFYAFTLVFLLMGFAAFSSRGQLIPVLAGLAALVLVVSAGQLSFSREWFAIGRVLGNSLEMRQEIQYALALTRWLALEGGRGGSLEALWSDLVFVARRLGFSRLKLKLGSGGRSWELPSKGRLLHTARHEIRGGRDGELELTVHDAPDPEESNPGNSDRGDALESPLRDRRSFDIMSELVAEGWMKAAARWRVAHQSPLVFDSESDFQQKPAELETLSP